jgi:hypothetical protein
MNGNPKEGRNHANMKEEDKRISLGSWETRLVRLSKLINSHKENSMLV